MIRHEAPPKSHDGRAILGKERGAAQVETWIERLTIDGWDRVLELDGVCLDLLGQIVEQGRPSESVA
jgi:hypothetical protein